MSAKGPLYKIRASPPLPDMGAEQSGSCRDYWDPEETWERYGFRIKSTVPHVPGRGKLRMLEDIKLTVTVECKKPVPLRTLSAYCWTNVFHKHNPEGVYHKINLPFVDGSREWDDWGVTTYTFSSVLYPTNNDECRITFYAQLGNINHWANKPEVDHILEVMPPRDNNAWSKQTNIAQITKHFFIGNYQAARNAKELGIDVIVRFCDKVPKKYKAKDGEILQIFHTFNKDSGAGSEIPAERLLETVEWLNNNRQKYKKVLIADEYGLGRVGSSMTALIFASNPSLTFEEAFQFVLNRKEIYSHKGLKNSLHTLFPRE
ncbi:dual specificity phosphatase, catalytic domain protein [Elysia marginata]|uniref:Dual specificity phosphatase, catalytic domain protein n=1 Tax=Elysia marginata TaxID=1093978 RepID=A0AAV4F778_9GAST|nr:dual specificity phosphatase, catalytic domain protein [Elysia marginata]